MIPSCFEVLEGKSGSAVAQVASAIGWVSQLGDNGNPVWHKVVQSVGMAMHTYGPLVQVTKPATIEHAKWIQKYAERKGTRVVDRTFVLTLS